VASGEVHSLDLSNELNTDEIQRVIKLNAGFAEYRQGQEYGSMVAPRPVAYAVPGNFSKISPPPYGILPTKGNIPRTMVPRLEVSTNGDFLLTFPVGDSGPPENLHKKSGTPPAIPIPRGTSGSSRRGPPRGSRAPHTIPRSRATPSRRTGTGTRP